MIFDSFFDEQDNYVLWLPVFFVVGCFVSFSFCIKSYIFLIISLVSFILISVTNKYFIKSLSLIILFVSLGSMRTYEYIRSYNKYPDIAYNLGKVYVVGEIKDKILKFQSNGELLRYLIVDVESIEPLNRKSKFSKDKNFQNPKFLRIKMQNSEDVEYGRVMIKASVLPIQNKNFDSDFDLRMYFHFKKIGGLGYDGEIVKYFEKSNKLTLKQILSNFRERIATRILLVRENSLSVNLLSVMITGQRNLADKNMLEIMNKSGLSHIMSISGLHMVILTSVIVFLMKQIFSLFDDVFIKYNIYKVSAVVSIIVNTLYILLCGLSISSIRAYIMNVIMLIGILIDRFNNPLRSIMFTMFVMVFSKPQIIYRTGFYMSFLSSIAIMAFMDYYYIYKYKDTDTDYNESNFFRYIKITLLVSIIVELAVLPMEIYSFNMFSFYNILTNIFINPLIFFVIIPFGLFSLLLMPLNLEKLVLLPISYLADFIIFLAKLSGKIKFSAIYVQSPNLFVVILMIFGILWLSLWSGNLRKLGIIFYLCGIFMILFQKNIDIIIDNRNNMLFFLDERNNVYVYNVNEYKTQNIVNKLGHNNFFDLEKSYLNTCRNNSDKCCSKIDIQKNNTITFYKNGNLIVIGKYKNYFYVKNKIGNMKIIKTKNNFIKSNWRTCK